MAHMFINGQSVGALSGRVLDVLSPIDGQKFEEIPRGEAPDVDAAVLAAQQALTSAWGRMTALERGRLLTKLGEKVLEHHAELAALEARDTGKPMTTARNDITVLARYFEFYGAGADKVHGMVLPFLDGYTVNVLREPLGVTAHIIPWNYPAQMLGRSIGPALAMRQCGGGQAVRGDADDRRPAGRGDERGGHPPGGLQRRARLRPGRAQTGRAAGRERRTRRRAPVAHDKTTNTPQRRASHMPRA